MKIYNSMRLSNHIVSQDVAQRNRSKQERGLAMVMAGIVVVFIICHSLRPIVFSYLLLTLDTMHTCNQAGSVTFLGPLWSHLLFSFNNLLLTINSSVNMVIYCCVNARFRRHITSLILPFTARSQTTSMFTTMPPREA